MAFLQRVGNYCLAVVCYTLFSESFWERVLFGVWPQKPEKRQVWNISISNDLLTLQMTHQLKMLQRNDYRNALVKKEKK